jgi:hypothetical protein
MDVGFDETTIIKSLILNKLGKLKMKFNRNYKDEKSQI